MESKHRICLNCGKELMGRSDKKYCNYYCKSALQYLTRKKEETLFFQIDRQLKKNRSLLKQFNKSGKTVIRKSEMLDLGFNPMYFTHYWKNTKGQVYLFCYEYGFLEILDNSKAKYLLVQWQNYMNKRIP